MDKEKTKKDFIARFTGAYETSFPEWVTPQQVWEYIENLNSELIAQAGQEKQLESARQQFTGWAAATNYPEDIISLIQAMGLTLEEWNSIKGDVAEEIDNKYVSEIDRYFGYVIEPTNGQ